MGTDIHAVIEVKKDGKWSAIKFPNKYFGQYEGEPETTEKVDFGRNYDAFAILADVRNGRGFAGCDTGDEFVPIAMPKGLPDDITEEARGVLSDEHTPTWVGISEMLAYDWTRTITKRGWVNGVEFERWDRAKEWNPCPKSYCGGVSGGNIDHVSAEEMRRKIASLRSPDECFLSPQQQQELEAKYSQTYCLISWQQPYTERAGELWTKVFPLMLKLSREFDDVRIVMDFDS